MSSTRTIQEVGRPSDSLSQTRDPLTMEMLMTRTDSKIRLTENTSSTPRSTTREQSFTSLCGYSR